MSSPYADRLAAALVEYQRLTGRTPAGERFDVARPEVEQAYEQFRRRPFRMPLGAKEGEWVALRAGLKPMVREVLGPPDLEASIQRWRALGLHWALADAGVERSGGGHLARGGQQRVVFVGSDPAALAEAAAMESAELRGARSMGLAQFKAEQGRQLGYPGCCVAFFGGLGNLRENRPAVAAAAAASERFDPALANTLLSVYHHVSWFPCRYDCEPSVALASDVAQALEREQPAAAAAARRFLSMPRLYLSDRLQLLIEGRWQGATLHVQAIHTPYAFDRRAEHAMLEWVLFADLGQELLEAQRVDSSTPWPAGAVWLPFGGGAGEAGAS